ncbi:MAG: c-type cytochrome [Bacteriovoracaceae bacterium]|nr:c-type cytochrome [Bacteriovoracaceae bacterium]
MKLLRLILGSLMVVMLVASCTKKTEVTEEDKKLLTEALEHFEAIPTQLINADENKELIALGKKLYLEKKLSINDTISCNSCHMLDKFGVDNERTSPGHDGTRGGRNSPTVYNAGLNFVQFWDGRAEDLAAQAIGPILNPIEHGMPSESAAMDKLKTAGYEDIFKQVFKNAPDAFSYKNVGVAIAGFEKTLLTPSRFDDYLKGDVHALSEKERKGLKRFIEIGCVSCHNGAGVGGGMYQKLGAVEEYPTKDLGRFEVTKQEDDKYFFKVPSLRNITKTAPYFHDGSLDTLDMVIPIMAKHQLGEQVTTDDVDAIKAFLDSLTAKDELKF